MQLYFAWHTGENVLNTSQIGVNLSVLGSVLRLFGLSSNLKYLRIFRTGLVASFLKKQKFHIFCCTETIRDDFFHTDPYRTEGQ